MDSIVRFDLTDPSDLLIVAHELIHHKCSQIDVPKAKQRKYQSGRKLARGEDGKDHGRNGPIHNPIAREEYQRGVRSRRYGKRATKFHLTDKTHRCRTFYTEKPANEDEAVRSYYVCAVRPSRYVNHVHQGLWFSHGLIV